MFLVHSLSYNLIVIAGRVNFQDREKKKNSAVSPWRENDTIALAPSSASVAPISMV